MAYGEDVIKLRTKIAEAVSLGVINPEGKSAVEAILLQVMNDCERSRQQCASQAESLRKEASKMDGQASGFSALIGIVYNVLNGFIALAEKSKREEEERAAEKAEIEDQVASLSNEQDQVAAPVEEVKTRNNTRRKI
jgi:hypothetical protein